MTVPRGTHGIQEVLEGGPETCPTILRWGAQATALPGNLPFGTSGLLASAWGAGPAQRAGHLLVIKTILTEHHSQRPSGKEVGATGLVVQSPTFIVQSSLLGLSSSKQASSQVSHHILLQAACFRLDLGRAISKEGCSP